MLKVLCNVNNNNPYNFFKVNFGWDYEIMQIKT
jgi:hypothetical protein